METNLIPNDIFLFLLRLSTGTISYDVLIDEALSLLEKYQELDYNEINVYSAHQRNR